MIRRADMVEQIDNEGDFPVEEFSVRKLYGAFPFVDEFRTGKWKAANCVNKRHLVTHFYDDDEQQSRSFGSTD